MTHPPFSRKVRMAVGDYVWTNMADHDLVAIARGRRWTTQDVVSHEPPDPGIKAALLLGWDGRL